MRNHSLTLTCDTCGKSETFTADKRYLVVMAIDESTWRTEPTEDGWSHTATCGACNGSVMTHAAHAAMITEGA